jgi:myo-inositol-1(or 4)-monophosphatase
VKTVRRDRVRDLQRIDDALTAAATVLADYTPGFIEATRKSGGDPVTEADEKVDELLKEMLPEAGEGWLSEETADSPDRLGRSRVWVVDPLDGTREFVEGIPEWCVSIGLVEDGVAVAGGIYNLVMDQRVVGSVETGVRLNGTPTGVRAITRLSGAEVLASRSEVRRGEWDEFRDGPIIVRPMGSVAYKMALVAAGLADATWTLTPKNEWDIAAGTALVLAGGGVVTYPDGSTPAFNNPDPLVPGLVAVPPGIQSAVKGLLG